MISSNGLDIELTSPNYPRSRLTNLECSYIIKFPQNRVLRLDFLELNFQNNNYKIDMYDGNDTTAEMIFQKTFSSEKNETKISVPIFSRGNELLIQLSHSRSSDLTNIHYNYYSHVTYKMRVEAKGIPAIFC